MRRRFWARERWRLGVYLFSGEKGAGISYDIIDFMLEAEMPLAMYYSNVIVGESHNNDFLPRFNRPDLRYHFRPYMLYPPCTLTYQLQVLELRESQGNRNEHH